MALFDVTAPAGNTKAGLGAKVIREEIKDALNDGLENVVIVIVDSVWECVQGWPRVYAAAAAAPPSPAANADAGRVWGVTDLSELRFHNGTAWVRASAPCDMRIPLIYGPAQQLTNADYGVMGHALLRVSADGSWAGANWAAGYGVNFNKANAPAGSTIKLCVVGGSVSAGQSKVKLYDVAAATDVVGSEITLAADAPLVRENLSGDLTSAIAAGDRIFRVYAKAGTASYYRIGAVELRIQKG